ncbi:MAG: DUF1902 domain-containing protein [Gammaproteobacteria bacterium]|nr:DUF1902 domain-containing protein [Gammaproteobacteria bacterium]
MTNSENREFKVEFERCTDGIYITKFSDIPGLVLETECFDELVETLLAIAPELLESNLKISPEEFDNVILHVYLTYENAGTRKGPRILVEKTDEHLVAA